MPEEIKITAESLVETVKSLIHEGTVRHIGIKDAAGKTVLEFPVAVGVLGIVIAPMLAAVAGLAVMAADYTLVVTREEDPTPPPTSDGSVS